MKIYIGGNYGLTPTVASTSVEAALLKTAQLNTSTRDQAADVEWMAEFVDGEPSTIRFTAECDGQRMYVESYELEGELED